MKLLNTIPLLLAGTLLFAVLPACSTSETATEEPVLQFDEDGLIDPEQFGSIEERSARQRENRIDPSKELIDHLRNIPGLNIRSHGNDYTIQMRGPTSIQGSSDMVLFVVNRTPVGRSYASAASLINMQNVQAINVMRPNEAHRRFGSDGSKGAIQIITD